MSKFVYAFVLALLSSFVNAALIESSWPPPGSPGFSGSGISPGHAGGSTWSFSSFDSAQYDELYFGIKDISMGEVVANAANAGLPGAGTGAVSMSYNAGLSNLASGIVVWDNSFQFYNAAINGYQLVSGRFTLTITDSSSNALALTDASSLGLDPNLGGMLNIAGDFNANMLFTINGSPAIQWYDSANNNPINQLSTSFSSAWFYTPPAAVPVPAAAWLFGSALVGLVGLGRRK